MVRANDIGHAIHGNVGAMAAMLRSKAEEGCVDKVTGCVTTWCP